MHRDGDRVDMPVRTLQSSNGRCRPVGKFMVRRSWKSILETDPVSDPGTGGFSKGWRYQKMSGQLCARWKTVACKSLDDQSVGKLPRFVNRQIAVIDLERHGT